MKLEIETSPKNVEQANCILGQAIKAIRSEGFLAEFKFTEKDLEAAERFRQSLLKAFLKGDL